MATSEYEPDEALVEDAARAMYEHRNATGDFVDGVTAWDDLPEDWRDEWRDGARAVLGAVGPLLLAQGWDEGREALALDTLPGHAPTPNPYRTEES